MSIPHSDKISTILKGLDEILKSTKQDLESFLNSYSQKVDSFILRTQRNENIKFSTGKAILKVVDDRSMQFSLDLYYQGKDGKYLNKKAKSGIMEMTDYLTDDAISFLVSKKEMSFEIEPPMERHI